MTEVIDEQGSLEIEIPEPPVTTAELIVGLGTMTAGAVVVCIGVHFNDATIYSSGFGAVNVGFAGLSYFGWRRAASKELLEAAIPEQPENPIA